MSVIVIHYDGDIVNNHRVSMMTLGKTLIHLQGALNRAYLDIRYDGVWKHAKVHLENINDVTFWTGTAKDGGYILDFVGSTEAGKSILNRVSAAMNPVYDSLKHDSIKRSTSLAQEARLKQMQISAAKSDKERQALLDAVSPELKKKYGDRSILKDINMMLAIVRSKNSGNSTLDLQLAGDRVSDYRFNKKNSITFNEMVSQKELGPLIEYEGELKSLDNINLNGSFLNYKTNKISTIKIKDSTDFAEIHPYLVRKVVKFFGTPIIEYGAYDDSAGDIYFIKVVT